MTRQKTLEEELARIEHAIANYEELDSDMESPEYVARGNGFCDSKYSEDFIERQLDKLRKERTALMVQMEARKQDGPSIHTRPNK